MSRRSRKHKKRFPCGHRGFGRYCHYCAQLAAAKQAKLSRRQAKRLAWQQSLQADVIDLTQLPKSVVVKARKVLEALEGGMRYWQMAGKRLKGIRHAIRIPVNRRYRLICEDIDNEIVPLKVVSHEEYNPLANDEKRLLSRTDSRGSGDR